MQCSFKDHCSRIASFSVSTIDGVEIKQLTSICDIHWFQLPKHIRDWIVGHRDKDDLRLAIAEANKWLHKLNHGHKVYSTRHRG